MPHRGPQHTCSPKDKAAVAVAAATPMTAAAVEQLIKARGTEGVVVLSQWFEKMESVFHISNCAVENQVKFATCTFLGNALTCLPHDEGKDVFHKESDEYGSKSPHYYGRPAEQNENVGIYAGKTIRGIKQQTSARTLGGLHCWPVKRGKYIGYTRMYQMQLSPQRTMRSQGHFKRDCPKLKNKNHGNQGGNGNAPTKVYVVGNAGTNPDSNVVTGTFLLNNRYASILFDTGADRSFVSTTFSSLIDITPTTLDYYYDVELADGKIIRINTIIRGCTLNFLDHPFNINLMPVELGSFDVIVGMDWLAKYHAVIDCAKKIVRIPWGNETLVVYGDGSNQGNRTCLNIISCTKTHKYLLKGHHVFLAHVTSKETEDKSGEKQLEDVPIV
ncbi:putative reverse transcriptase domain-containing protein [Tanacetum coccineum]